MRPCHLGDRCVDHHEGQAQAVPSSRGGTLIVCPYGHYVDYVAKGQWLYSTWSVRIPWRDAHIVCHGKLRTEVTNAVSTDV